MKYAIVLLLICWFPISGMADLCKAASYSVHGQVLKNHTITSVPAEQIEQCIIQCMDYPGCHSSNFYRKDRVCELNDKTHASHPEDMREEHLTNYMENTFRPFTCSKDSDCGSNLLCLPSLMRCGGYKSVGCYKDTSSRAIPSLEGSDPILDGSYSRRKNPIAKCAVAAIRKGYSIFAVQNGGWCAASATAPQTFDKYGKSNACKADGEGGTWANQVYSFL